MAHQTTQPQLADDRVAQTHVLAVGDWQQREFAAAVAAMPESHDWPHAANFDAACYTLGNCESPPELIFLAQPLPGEIRQAQIDRLQQLVPLTRLVIVNGSWCEGELRTGMPPTGAIRLYWYELANWWRTALRQRDAGRCPLWSLPLDHSQAGRWSAVNDRSSQGSERLSVVVDAADYAAFETIAAALDAQEMHVSWRGCDERSTAGATVGIWDGGQLSQRELERLSNFCGEVAGPVIALLDYPRIQHIEQAKTAGAAAILAKPYIVEELIAALIC